MNEEDIEELKRLFYSDRLTQYGKRKLIGYYEQQIKELEEDYTSVYLKGVYDERDKWKSKIKERVKELKEKYNKVVNEVNEQGLIDQLIDFKEVSSQIQVLKELLQEGE